MSVGSLIRTGERDRLPPGWSWARLGDVCDPHIEQFDPRATPSRMFHYIDISSIDSVRKCITEAREIPSEAAPSRARQRVRAGDVLVATTRPNLNAVALVPPELEGAVCSTGFCVLRPTDAVDRGYLFAFVRTAAFVDALARLVQGALYPAVRDREVREQEIPLPPLPDQKRIVAILNEQMAAVERARGAAEAQLGAAKALPAAYLREAFESPEAKAWPRVRLGACCRLLPARAISTDGDAEITAVTTACLSEFGFQPSGLKRARMRSDAAEEAKVAAGEVLVARSNTADLVGRVAMYAGEPPGVVASDLTIRLMPTNGMTSQFLSGYLAYLYVTGYWRQRAGGASGSMKKITRRQMQAVDVPLPDGPTRNGVSSSIEHRMMEAARLVSALETRLADIGRLPPRLLRKAFRGEL